ncbi:ABC transporter substrate-binding protein [Undibacterium sp.]|jgi:phospholipid transport system substrate-binding protein|uniref:MlaC/ttg2D family ABC transporter substrate-binding protein n=1 Tax=Undibacterium sp. TaxID=1914977 RepID=UPI002B871240|nr:ABC transporter substrate-binding protein [Undibacterium sp.]HTD03999.1 ABC transporter substrate-binding protein [Undibacterium sp.]
MNILNKFLALVLTLGAAGFINAAAAQEAPDVLIKRISLDVLDTAKADKEIQGGNKKKVLTLVQEKILPYVDFQRMTSLAVGQPWRNATPEQQKQLIQEFRDLLVFTYSGAISAIKDQKITFAPLRGDPAATDGVEVRSQVLQPGRETIRLNYRMEKVDGAWKIYDFSILGAWLVETYKGTFEDEISKGGIDGLIKTLANKNKALAG